MLCDTDIGSSGSVVLPEVANSLRFDGTNDYLARTPGIAGNRKTWTWSGWVKRGTINAGANTLLFSAAGTTYDNAIHITGGGVNDILRLQFDGNNAGVVPTSGVLRDPSAWYHIIVAVDTTQATATNRVRIYINGAEVLYGSATYPTQNYDTMFNSTNVHNIGRSATGGAQHFDGYLSNICFIDGQSLIPTSFAYTDPNGQWRSLAKSALITLASAGGTNSFFLPFDNGASTVTLGYDASSKANNWTLNNMVRDGSATDCWSYDTPTNNFAVLNPLEKLSSGTIANGSLDTTGQTACAPASIAISTGKWYFEGSFSAVSGASSLVQIGIQQLSPGNIQAYMNTGIKDLDSAQSAFGAAYAVGDVIGCAVDLDNKQMTFYKNGVLQGQFTFTLGGNYYPMFRSRGTTTFSGSINFGQRPVASGAWDSASGGYFRYTPPAGFKALCTKNLPIPSIIKPNKHFDATCYTGNGSAGGQSITNPGQFQPDLVWLKGRSAVSEHDQFDSVRGGTKYLVSNNINAEQTGTGITFNSNGFSLAGSQYNDNALAVVGWQWKAGGVAVTNNAGSISSQVSVNTQSGFSIVTYTGTGANATVGHGLGAAPKLIIFKQRDGSGSWPVYYHVPEASLGFGVRYLLLNTTDASTYETGIWQSSIADSSKFYIGNSTYYNINAVNGQHLAYCFTEIPGFSKISSYTGNGSTDGPFVWCGFRPKYVLIKRTDTTGHWRIVDTARSAYNANGLDLYPNLSNAEGSVAFDFLSNGFKPRVTAPDYNASGATYIYVCFAESPFKYSNAR